MVTISDRRTRLPFIFGGIRIKFFLTYVLIVAAVLVIFNIYPLTVTRDFIFESKIRDLNNQTSLIATSVEALDTLTADNVALVMDVLETDELDSVIIVDSEQKVLYQEIYEGYDMSEKYFWGIEAALGRQTASYSELKNGVFISVYSMPIIHLGRIIGAVCLMNYDTVQWSMISALRSNLMKITIVVSVISILVCIFFTMKISSRIRGVLTGIRSVREGEYSYRINMNGHDEIALLAEEFNSLAGRLQKTEEIRRQFVSDASHELKTPLASIQLLSDSIVQNNITDAETVTEFVSDIGDEARRLARTTEKLLRLTNLDNKIVQNYKPEDIGLIAEKTVKILTPIAKERNITIKTDFTPGCIINAAQDDIYEIIINLVENAIKYNVDGGEVLVSITKNDSQVMLQVADTGVGIPEEDLPMIFDRFYRVDKARSRANGGSGLGLSIVKSSVEQYGGKITATPRESGGMLFTVIFDRYEEEKDE